MILLSFMSVCVSISQFPMKTIAQIIHETKTNGDVRCHSPESFLKFILTIISIALHGGFPCLYLCGSGSKGQGQRSGVNLRKVRRRPRDLTLGDGELILYIAYVTLIWAPLIPGY